MSLTPEEQARYEELDRWVKNYEEKQKLQRADQVQNNLLQDSSANVPEEGPLVRTAPEVELIDGQSARAAQNIGSGGAQVNDFAAHPAIDSTDRLYAKMFLHHAPNHMLKYFRELKGPDNKTPKYPDFEFVMNAGEVLVRGPRESEYKRLDPSPAGPISLLQDMPMDIAESAIDIGSDIASTAVGGAAGIGTFGATMGNIPAAVTAGIGASALTGGTIEALRQKFAQARHGAPMNLGEISIAAGASGIGQGISGIAPAAKTLAKSSYTSAEKTALRRTSPVVRFMDKFTEGKASAGEKIGPPLMNAYRQAQTGVPATVWEAISEPKWYDWLMKQRDRIKNLRPAGESKKEFEAAIETLKKSPEGRKAAEARKIIENQGDEIARGAGVTLEITQEAKTEIAKADEYLRKLGSRIDEGIADSEKAYLKQTGKPLKVDLGPEVKELFTQYEAKLGSMEGLPAPQTERMKEVYSEIVDEFRQGKSTPKPKITVKGGEVVSVKDIEVPMSLKAIQKMAQVFADRAGYHKQSSQTLSVLSPKDALKNREAADLAEGVRQNLTAILNDRLPEYAKESRQRWHEVKRVRDIVADSMGTETQAYRSLRNSMESADKTLIENMRLLDNLAETNFEKGPVLKATIVKHILDPIWNPISSRSVTATTRQLLSDVIGKTAGKAAGLVYGPLETPVRTAIGVLAPAPEAHVMSIGRAIEKSKLPPSTGLWNKIKTTAPKTAPIITRESARDLLREQEDPFYRTQDPKLEESIYGRYR